MMSRLLFASVFVLLSFNVFSQNMWFRDFASAQSYALEEGKLIVIDFWASWCGPCRDMDLKLWGSDEFAAISQNVVLLKVDIDMNSNMASRYNVKSIPKVVIADATGDMLIEKMGFSNANSYLNLFSKLPGDVSDLNKTLLPIIENDYDDLANYNVGLAYQKLARENDSYPCLDVFLGRSNAYFKKVKGKDGEDALADLSELNHILNMAYRGRTKQAQKKLAKLEDKYSDTRTVELLDFIQAYCFKIEGDKANFLIKKKQIKNEVYLSQLEN